MLVHEMTGHGILMGQPRVPVTDECRSVLRLSDDGRLVLDKSLTMTTDHTGQPVRVRIGIDMRFALGAQVSAENKRDATLIATQFDSKGVDFGPWLGSFTRLVRHNWLISAAAMRSSGHVVIHLNVRKDGALTDIEVVEPSSITWFNVAAENALTM
jgi:outer membrane biosynthesis protein TonB